MHWNRYSNYGQRRTIPSVFYQNTEWDAGVIVQNDSFLFELGKTIATNLISNAARIFIILEYTKTTD